MMKTGIQRQYDTWRLGDSRSTSSVIKEITDIPIRHRQDKDEILISRPGSLRRFAICGAVGCRCFQICACGGGAYYGARTVEQVDGL